MSVTAEKTHVRLIVKYEDAPDYTNNFVDVDAPDDAFLEGAEAVAILQNQQITDVIKREQFTLYRD